MTNQNIILEAAFSLLEKQKLAMQKEIQKQELTQEDKNILDNLKNRDSELTTTIQLMLKMLENIEVTEKELNLVVNLKKKLNLIGVKDNEIILQNTITNNPFNLGAEINFVLNTELLYRLKPVLLAFDLNVM